jgi:hypothetical protein
MKTPIFGPQASPPRPGRVLLGQVPVRLQGLVLIGLAAFRPGRHRHPP